MKPFQEAEQFKGVGKKGIKRLQGVFEKLSRDQEKSRKLNILLFEVVKNSFEDPHTLLLPVNYLIKTNDLRLITKAFNFSFERHSHQKRASGEEYFEHLYETALILAKYSADSETIAAGLLHDVIEDTETNEEELRKNFGNNLTEIILGLTKLPKNEAGKISKEAYLKKLFEASSDDIRILLIKLADKLHNIKTIEFLPKQKRIQIAKHALNFYVPLAHRLGLHKLEQEMANQCFHVMNEKKALEFGEKLSPKYKEKKEEMDMAKKIIEKITQKNKIKCSFEVRKNSPYSIYNKMKWTKKELSQIYDFYTLIISTKQVSDCYRIMGQIHSVFKPLPRKVKDFIALPSMLTYQSIHTSVIGPKGKPIKIYIRSDKMQALAQKGIIYFLNDKKRIKEVNDAWKEIIAKHPDINEIDFAKFLKTDVLASEIKIFDSQGNTFDFPQNANVLDFTFRFYGKQALKLDKVFVNGKKTGFNKKLIFGDIVELSFSNQDQVKKEWMKIGRLKETISQIKK